jgi:hypothetical protein
MRKLWPLVLLGVVFFMWNKQCSLPTQLTGSQHTAPRPADSVAGGPVRQWEHEATDMSAREQALPPAGGVSAGGMIGSARQGLQGK